MNENNFEFQTNELDTRAVKDYFLRFGLACLLLVTVNIVLQYLLAFTLGDTAFGNHWSFNWFLSLAPLYCVALPIFWLTLPKPPAVIKERRPFGKGRFVIVCIVCLSAMMTLNYVGFYFTELINLISGGTLGNNDALTSIVNASPTWATVVFACIAAPIMEELIFRKLLIDRVKPFGELQACLLSGLVFGMFHGNFRQFFYAAALGAIFAFVYVKTNNIIHSIALHMGVNILGSVVMPAILSNENLAVIDRLAADPASMTTTDALTVLLVAGTLMIGGGLVVTGIVLFFANLRKIKFDAPDYTVNGGVTRLIYSAPTLIAALTVMAGMFVLALL